MQMAIPERNAEAFRQALLALNTSGVPYVIGGAFAMHRYSGVWRNTNDLDIYLERQYIERAVDALSQAGFLDCGEMAVGDREWIYHATKKRVLVDLIWQPPNHLSPVDESFHARGQEGAFLEVPVRFIPPDELLWAKVFTLNRDRCDWPDLFHVVRARPGGLDWEHVVRKMGEHWPVLLSFIILYDWAYPSETQCIPRGLREELLERKLSLLMPSEGPTREAVLDPWTHTRGLPP